LGIILNDLALRDPCQDIPNQDTICGNLIVAMLRDHDLAACHQSHNAIEGLTCQGVPPSPFPFYRIVLHAIEFLKGQDNRTRLLAAPQFFFIPRQGA